MNLEKDIAEGLDVRTRLVIWMSVVLGLIVAGIVLVAWAEHRGAMLERAGWEKKETQRQKDKADLLRKHAAEVAALTEQYHLNNLKVSIDHENELEALRRDRAADRLAFDRAGGLRVTRAVCDSPAAGPEAAGAGGRDEASASTVRLPEPIESDLWAIVNDADEVSAQLRSCQAWIVANGFYGPKPAESMPLLDRMVSSQNHDNEAQHATDD
jgi:hypothetical protein